MSVQIRVGIEGGRRPVLARAKEIGAPILVSANSLWDNNRKRFGGWQCYSSHDTALDCGGFVAMKRYGGYRWNVEQYVALAMQMQPAWWAQMDFCCEPEIASDRGTVFKRIDQTAEYLHDCQDTARRIGTSMPMPVLQGWNPSDYCQGPIYDSGFEWPELVGVGSVCRRRVGGQDGIVAVISALDAKVPKHVKFHLFGVKSTAFKTLIAEFNHRIASVDSMAWNFACRIEAHQKKVVCDGAMRADFMSRWYLRQQSQSAQDGQLRLQFN